MLLAVLAGPPVSAQSAPTDPAARPRIGLVLSGGGARGAAHIGVLKVLEELRIPIDALAANSMGALVGGGYAYGRSPAELAKTLTGIDWSIALSDRPARRDLSFRRKEDSLNFLIDLTFGYTDFRIVLPKGLVQGNYTGNVLRFMTTEAHALRHFDDLPIPYRAVATEIGTGNQVVLDSGSLPQAMAASMAIPGVFAPVEIDGRELVDGMVVNNIPIDVGRAMGVDVIIAVDIGTPLLKPEEITSLLEVTSQMISILMQKNIDERLALLTDDDLLISPDLGDITSTDFERVAEAIDVGEQAARAVANELRRFSVSEAEYAAYLQRQRRPPTAYPLIDRVVVENRSNLADEVITSRLETRAGVPFDPETLRRDINRIYGLDEFDRVTFDIQKHDGLTQLRLLVVARSWGPNYLRFGLNITDDFDGNAAYGFAVNYTARSINRLGAEWRNDLSLGREIRVRSEFYQPLDPRSRFFVAPSGEFRDLNIDQFAAGSRVAELDVQFGQVAFDVGTRLGDLAELRVGLHRSWGRADVESSATPMPNIDFEDGVLAASLVVDDLDNPNFPSAGGVLASEYVMSVDGLGADDDYQRFEASAAYAVTLANTTFLAVANFGTELEGDLPVYRQHQRGGFLDLSGFNERELVGQHAAVFSLVNYTLLTGERADVFGMPVYLGGSIETGNVVNRRSQLFNDLVLAGSVFLGVESILGPVYFGYGMAEGGHDSLTLFIGRTF